MKHLYVIAFICTVFSSARAAPAATFRDRCESTVLELKDGNPWPLAKAKVVLERAVCLPGPDAPRITSMNERLKDGRVAVSGELTPSDWKLVITLVDAKGEKKEMLEMLAITALKNGNLVVLAPDSPNELATCRKFFRRGAELHVLTFFDESLAKSGEGPSRCAPGQISDFIYRQT